MLISHPCSPADPVFSTINLPAISHKVVRRALRESRLPKIPLSITTARSAPIVRTASPDTNASWSARIAATTSAARTTTEKQRIENNKRLIARSRVQRQSGQASLGASVRHLRFDAIVDPRIYLQYEVCFYARHVRRVLLHARPAVWVIKARFGFTTRPHSALLMRFLLFRHSIFKSRVLRQGPMRSVLLNARLHATASRRAGCCCSR